LNLRPLGYERYDGRLRRLVLSPVAAVTSADGLRSVAVGLARLPRLGVSRAPRAQIRARELRPGGRNPPPPASTRPADPDVVPAHGDVIVSEGPGDEVLRGEDVAARKPASNNWTTASREDRRGSDRQASAGPSVAWLGSTPDGRGGTSPSGRVPLHRNYNGRYRPQNRAQSVAAGTDTGGCLLKAIVVTDQAAERPG
jgi:hypothetical protein